MVNLQFVMTGGHRSPYTFTSICVRSDAVYSQLSKLVHCSSIHTEWMDTRNELRLKDRKHVRTYGSKRWTVSPFHFGSEIQGLPALDFCLSRAGGKLIKGSFTTTWWKITTTSSWPIDSDEERSGSLISSWPIDGLGRLINQSKDYIRHFIVINICGF